MYTIVGQDSVVPMLGVGYRKAMFCKQECYGTAQGLNTCQEKNIVISTES